MIYPITCTNCGQPITHAIWCIVKDGLPLCGRRCLGDYASKVPILARFWSRITLVDRGLPLLCWEWIGAATDKGYGKMKANVYGNKLVFTHVYAYELYLGPVPIGLELDHLCRHPRCANPWHLEPVTHLVNMQRAWSARTLVNGQRVCARGHPQTPENVYTPKKGRWVGKKWCKICKAMIAKVTSAGTSASVT